MASKALKTGDAFTAVAGPWHGVNSTNQPFDESSDYLQGAINGYLPNPTEGSEFFSRPGCTRIASIGTGTSPTAHGQGGYSHTDASGTTYNFQFRNGKIYRMDGTGFTTPTDVTPVNVGQFPGAVAIYGTSLGGSMIISDSFNPPWVASNLSSTPITATFIDYATATTILSRSISADTKVASTATPYFIRSTGAIGVLAAIPAGTALPTGTVPQLTWAVYRMTTDGSSVTITPGAANFTTGYADEAAAIAAVPTVATSAFDMGYFTLRAQVTHPFIDGTDALAGGASGNPASITNYYAGASAPWSAWGQPVVYGGALFFIMRFLITAALGVQSARTTITWSDPNTPGIGYAQANFDNQWTLTQTGDSALFALAATNTNLFYSRALSWGALSGNPGVNFRNTATHDLISINVGCVACSTVQVFGSYVYFADALGRPWRFAAGSVPEDIWQSMRADYESQTGSLDISKVIQCAWAVVEPNLNIYCVAPWNTPSFPDSTQILYIFDALSGLYMGTWNVDSFIGLDRGWIARNPDDASYNFLFQQAPDPTDSDALYYWRLRRVADAIFQDRGHNISPSVTTQRFGFSAAYEVTPQWVRALEGRFNSAMTLTVTTSNAALQVIGSRTPPTSADGTYRAVWGMDRSPGRGITCIVSADTTVTQWQCYRVEADLTVALAGIEER